ncbi:MAG TPA: VanZ family protein [Thermoanaerobaculia bacterium]|nr:VanZ family protein [Thermoanaerobaculia bacterium]
MRFRAEALPGRRASRHRPAAIAWSSLALSWTLLVWVLLTAPQTPESQLVDALLPALLRPWQDKLAHLMLFLVQTLLVERAASARRRPASTRDRWHALLLAIGCSLALGAATELRQRTIPSRDADPLDFAADAAGAATWAGTLALSRRYARARAPA